MFGSKFGFQSGRVDLISTKWASKAKVSVLGKSRFFEISEIQFLLIAYGKKAKMLFDLKCF